MGFIYSIKPIEALFEFLLLEHEGFRDMIQRAPPINDIDGIHEDRWIVDKYLGTFFLRFAKHGGECFNPWFELSKYIQGRPNLFAETCMKGDFTLYEKYISTITKSDMRWRNGDAMNGIFGLMVLFMRYDLIKNYIHCRDQIHEVNEILNFVLNPTIMLEYKNLLLKDKMIPLTQKDIFNMDIFKNIKIFHPKKRIFLFYKLCYSTYLAI